MANFWTDDFAPTSIGTGVAKTTLAGGADYNVSQKAGALIQVVSNVAQTGAMTAAESMMVRSIIESPAIPSITPKEWVQSFGLGGLGTFTFGLAPMLTATPIQTPLPYATTPITFSGQAQIANTVAAEMNMELTFSSGSPTETEYFYDAPDNETNTGTAAGNVAGGDITINGGARLCTVSCVVTPGVVTASESFNVRGELASTNFLGVPSPQRWAAQTIASALGTTTSVGVPADRRVNVNIPIGNTFLGNTSIDLDEAQTATGNFIIWVGFKKSMN